MQRLFHPPRLSGSHWASSYGRFLTLLCLLVCAGATLFSSLGCVNCTSAEVKERMRASIHTLAAVIQIMGDDDGASTAAVPGERVVRALRVSAAAQPAPGAATCTYWPPDGATNFVFDLAPANPDGPIPFVFPDLPLGSTVQAAFNLPTLPAGQGERITVESLECSDGAGETVVSALQTTIRAPGAVQAVQAVQAPPAALALPAAPLTDTAPVWQVWQAYDPPPDRVLTTAECQQAVDMANAGLLFAAANLPLPAHDAGESATLPIFDSHAFTPVLVLREWGGSAIMTATLAIQPGYSSAVANLLPPSPGSQWTPIGVQSITPDACPQDLNVAAGRWGAVLTLPVDFSAQPDECVGCVIPVYYCYAGQPSPADPLSAARLAAGAAGQGENITCAGPQLFGVQPYPYIWRLEGTSGVVVTPTETISLHHAISFGPGTGAHMVDIAVSSSLGAPITLYGGDYNAIDLTKPLTPPLEVVGWQDVWLLVGPAPADVAPGLHTVQITATTDLTPTSMSMVDSAWVGEWRPPPQPACAALAAVAISGPAAVAPGAPLQLAASAAPGAATTPYSYTWTATALPPITHTLRGYTDTAVFTWPSAGSYTVTVTAGNCGGTVSAAQRVEVGGGAAYPLNLPYIRQAGP